MTDAGKQLATDDLSRHFGACIKAARERRGFTQQQLADRLRAFGWKIDTSGITRIENGTRDPRISEAQELATALGLELADLVPKSSNDLAVAELRRDMDEARARLIDATAMYESARTRWALAVDHEGSTNDVSAAFASRSASDVIRRELELKQRKGATTTTSAVDTFEVHYACPWCRQQISVAVEVGASNYEKGRSGKRTTGITSRRTEMAYHDCCAPS